MAHHPVSDHRGIELVEMGERVLDRLLLDANPETSRQ
jgi:hypothetical protein